MADDAKNAEKEKSSVKISLHDMKIIIHGLRMSGFAFLESDAVDAVNAMIKNLPTAEAIDQLYENSREVKRLSAAIGEIMSVIDHYGTKNTEFKARYKAKTKLPPRYKVLDWDDKVRKANIVTDLVKMSKSMDSVGNEDASGEFLKCAKLISLNKKADVLSIVDKHADHLSTKELKSLKRIADYAQQATENAQQMGSQNFNDTMAPMMQVLMSKDAWSADMSTAYISAYSEILKQMETISNQTAALIAESQDAKEQSSLMALSQINQDVSASILSFKEQLNSTLVGLDNYTGNKDSARDRMSGDGYALPEMAGSMASINREVQDLIKLSEKTECIKSHNISGKILVCAKKIANDDLSYLKEASSVADMFREAGMEEEAELFMDKSAGIWDRFVGKKEVVEPDVEQRAKQEMASLGASWEKASNFFRLFMADAEKMGARWEKGGWKPKFDAILSAGQGVLESLETFGQPENFDITVAAPEATVEEEPLAEEPAAVANEHLNSAFDELGVDINGSTLNIMQIDAILQHLNQVVNTPAVPTPTPPAVPTGAPTPTVTTSGSDKVIVEAAPAPAGGARITSPVPAPIKLDPSSFINQMIDPNQTIDAASAKTLIDYFTQLKETSVADETSAQETVQKEYNKSMGIDTDMISNIADQFLKGNKSFGFPAWTKLEKTVRYLSMWQSDIDNNPALAVTNIAKSKPFFNLKMAATSPWSDEMRTFLTLMSNGKYQDVNPVKALQLMQAEWPNYMIYMMQDKPFYQLLKEVGISHFQNIANVAPGMNLVQYFEMGNGKQALLALSGMTDAVKALGSNGHLLKVMADKDPQLAMSLRNITNDGNYNAVVNAVTTYGDTVYGDASKKDQVLQGLDQMRTLIQTNLT